MKSKKGITLIALIITIIVMLILVGVTINIVIQGGLFGQAQDAVRKQEEQTIYEQMLSMIVWNQDGSINVKATVEAIENSGAFTIKSKDPSQITDSTTEVTITITGKNGDYSYKITEKEISIASSEGQNTSSSQLTVTAEVTNKTLISARIDIRASKTFSDADGKKYICKFLNIPENSSYEAIDLAYYNMMMENEGGPKIESYTELQELAESQGIKANISGEELISLLFDGMTIGQVAGLVYMQENTKVIKINNETLDIMGGDGTANYTVDKNGEYNISVTIGDETATCKVQVEGLNNKLGKYIRIEGNSELWRVLYDDQTHGVQLITANTLEPENVFLGLNDRLIDLTDEAVVAEVDILNDYESLSSDTNNIVTGAEKCIYSYNHAIEHLNKTCATLVGNTNLNVRCIGSNPTNKNSENSTRYTSDYLLQGPTSDTIYPAGSFNGIGKSEDTNYLEDYEQMKLLGISKSDNSQTYWLASRSIQEYGETEDGPINRIFFYVRSIREYGEVDDGIVFFIENSGFIRGDYYYGVRPVVMLSAGSLDNVTGSGTSSDPFIMH